MIIDEVQGMAFMIIANAGEAFDHFYRAADHAIEYCFDKAEEEMKLGNECLNKAHESQTKLLIAEANREDIPYSLIMSHAQDHLTMAIFSGRQSKQMIKLCRKNYELERGEN